LDFLLDYFSVPAVLKIELETHELSVLKGSDSAIREIRPTIWCKVSQANSAEITEMLRAADADFVEQTSNPIPPQIGRFDTLAVPLPL
jgi:hypothetical protein